MSRNGLLRSLLTGLVACPLCGRSGGHIRAGARVCTKCEGELKPTRLALWRAMTRTSIKELCDLARVSRATLQRALRGDPIGIDAARRLGRITKIDPAVLRVGRPPL